MVRHAQSIGAGVAAAATLALAAVLAVVLAMPATPETASAQAYQCGIPSAPVTVPPIRRDGPVRQMPVGGYTLALSWSPEFCRFRDGEPRHGAQCSGRNGRFAFVVHGLWPEGRGRDWPQWCPTARKPSPAAVRASLCMTPDARLIAHEWAKHGACMVRDPDGYLKITRILWDSLRWPDFDSLSRNRALTAGDVRQTFADANPYWEAHMVGLATNGRGWLTEMRLCYDIRFRPARCDARRLGPADSERVRIWRGL